MKRVFLLISGLFLGGLLQAQTEAAAAFGLGGLFGAVTVDGENYQMLGFRPQFHFGEFAIGLDITLLFDEHANIREEDWDDWEDYIDKLYFISWADPGAPFYIRLGGLETTTMGYGILVYGYTNLREYPAVKRLGLDLRFETQYVGGQAFVGDLKDLWRTDAAGEWKPAPVAGARLNARLFDILRIGGSFAGDFNEYNGLVSGEELYQGQESSSYFWAADAAVRLLESEPFVIDLYGQFAQSINTSGWGFSLPGFRFGIGHSAELFLEYRQTGGKFLFGYYNDTYDLERASIYDDNGVPMVKTKSERLNSAPELYGCFTGLKMNIFKVITGSAEFQYMFNQGATVHDFSMRASLGLTEGTIPTVRTMEVYYIMNNRPDFRLLSESTVLGATVGLELAPGSTIKLLFNVLCTDKNGDGDISWNDETSMEFSIVTEMSF
jgi:hypothetical protein